MHAARENLMKLISNGRKALNHVKAIAEQLPSAGRWKDAAGLYRRQNHPKLTPRLPALGAFLTA
jgi:hypothetical protein